MTSRRAQHRVATIGEIKAAALGQIEDVGAADLSLREVGRQIGMSVAGLYRYYDSRDALLTDLIADTFADLAKAVAEAGSEADPSVTAASRLIAGSLGYRRWSLDNPNRFALIFGTPVPGYAAPEAGPTVKAVMELWVAFGSIVRAGADDGSIDVTQWDGPLTKRGEATASGAGAAGAADVRANIAWWALVHGLVVLEMQNHIAWAIADQEEFFVGELERWLSGSEG